MSSSISHNTKKAFDSNDYSIILSSPYCGPLQRQLLQSLGVDSPTQAAKQVEKIRVMYEKCVQRMQNSKEEQECDKAALANKFYS